MNEHLKKYRERETDRQKEKKNYDILSICELSSCAAIFGRFLLCNIFADLRCCCSNGNSNGNSSELHHCRYFSLVISIVAAHSAMYSQISADVGRLFMCVCACVVIVVIFHLNCDYTQVYIIFVT